MASTAAEAAEITFGEEGFPNVPRFSSLLRFLELCRAGATIHSDILDTVIVKTDTGQWIYNKERLSAQQIVTEFRLGLSEDDPAMTSAVLDNTCACVEPMDALAIKKEVGSSN